MYTEWDGSLRLLDLKTEEMMRLLELLSRRCKNWTDPTMKSWPSPLMTLVCSWRRWTGSGSKEDVWKKRWKMNQQIRKNVGPGMRTMCFWCATDPKGEMIGNRKILSAGSTWKNLGLDMPSLDATKKLIEHQVSNSWSLNFYKSLIKWLFMICVHVSECHDMFFTEKIYICTHIICIYIYTYARWEFVCVHIQIIIY